MNKKGIDDNLLLYIVYAFFIALALAGAYLLFKFLRG